MFAFCSHTYLYHGACLCVIFVHVCITVCMHMEDYHIFLYIYNENATIVVILEDREKMDPLSDSVPVGIDIERNYFFFCFLFRLSIRRYQSFHYTYLTSSGVLTCHMGDLSSCDRVRTYDPGI